MRRCQIGAKMAWGRGHTRRTRQSGQGDRQRPSRTREEREGERFGILHTRLNSFTPHRPAAPTVSVVQKRSVGDPEMSQSADPFHNPRATAPVNFSALMILYSAPTRISSGLSWPGAMAVAPSKNAKTEKGGAI